MTLVVEDGTGLSNADSYNSIAEIEAYALDHGGSASWLGTHAVASLRIPEQVSDGDTFTIGAKTYALQATLTDSDGNIQIGADVAATRQNILDAINLTGTPGTQYASSMTIHPYVLAVDIESHTIFLRAILTGTYENTLATTETFTSASNVFGATTMSGGADATLNETEKEGFAREGAIYLDTAFAYRGARANEAQAREWPRTGAVDDSGYELDDDVLPQQVKDAHAVASIKASAGTLQPDSVQEGALTVDMVRVEGVITERKEYTEGGRSNVTHYRQLEGILGQLLEYGGLLERA